MQYNGGKARIARELAAVISSFKPKVYWEPFVGAANVIQLVEAPVRIGSDIDPHIISYLQSIQAGWLPPSEISKEDYYFWKRKIPSTQEEFAMKAATGYGASFGGRFFEGYSLKPGCNVGNIRQGAIKQASKLQKISFKSGNFIDSIPEGTDLIYADPPYANSKKVGTQLHFDTSMFWAWALACSLTGIRVLVSEFSAPSFATEIWNRSIVRALRPTVRDRIMTERLYLVGSL